MRDLWKLEQWLRSLPAGSELSLESRGLRIWAGAWLPGALDGGRDPLGEEAEGPSLVAALEGLRWRLEKAAADAEISQEERQPPKRRRKPKLEIVK